MRIAFLSDIHGNREALDACLAQVARQKVDRIVFLGDLVGYGADPVYIVDRVHEEVEKGALALIGNHDQAAISGSGAGMNEYARAAAEWTHDELDAEQRNWLATLPASLVDEDRYYVHSEASAPSRWLYVNDAGGAERSMRAVPHRVTFCGHVHRPQLYHMTPSKPAVLFVPQTGAPIPLLGNRQWLGVIGSVGQPRDDNPAAAWALIDTRTNELTCLRAPYDIEQAAEKIHAAGLPRILAARLFVGR